MAKKITDELYSAYEQWIKTEDRANTLHHAFAILADKHTGTSDIMDRGGLIVELARRRLNGELPSGKATDSESVIEGSIPSSPKEHVPIKK